MAQTIKDHVVALQKERLHPFPLRTDGTPAILNWDNPKVRVNARLFGEHHGIGILTDGEIEVVREPNHDRSNRDDPDRSTSSSNTVPSRETGHGLMEFKPGPETKTDSAGRRVYIWPGWAQPLVSVTTVVSIMHDYNLQYVREKIIAETAVNTSEWHDLSDDDAIRYLSGTATRNFNESAEEGSAIHVALAAALASKSTIENPPDPANMEWWNQPVRAEHVTVAEDFLRYHGLDLGVYAIELPVANFDLGYAGTADFLALGPDRHLWLIDWKTGKHIKRQAALQQAGLKNCTHYWWDGKTRAFSRPIQHMIVAKLDAKSWRRYRLLGHYEKAWSLFQNLIPAARYDIEEANTVGNLFEPSDGRKVK